MSPGRRSSLGIGLAVVVALGAPAARASFHLMQIEQALGGVCGDTSAQAIAQAIQLRMRSGGQNLVSGRNHGDFK